MAMAWQYGHGAEASRRIRSELESSGIIQSESREGSLKIMDPPYTTLYFTSLLEFLLVLGQSVSVQDADFGSWIISQK